MLRIKGHNHATAGGPAWPGPLSAPGHRTRGRATKRRLRGLGGPGSRRPRRDRAAGRSSSPPTQRAGPAPPHRSPGARRAAWQLPSAGNSSNSSSSSRRPRSTGCFFSDIAPRRAPQRAEPPQTWKPQRSSAADTANAGATIETSQEELRGSARNAGISRVRPALPVGVAGPLAYLEQWAVLFYRFCFIVLSFFFHSCRLPDCERLTVYKITRDHYLA